MKIDKRNLPKEVSNRHNVVNKRLKQLWKEDQSFQDGFRRIFDYYFHKFSKVSSRLNKEEFFERFFDYISDLFYQGYFLGRELLEHEEVTVGDRFFEQPNGVIKEQTFDILSGAAGDLVQILSNESNLAFDTWVLDEDESLLNTLRQIKIDVACLGAYQCFLDERKSRDVYIKAEPQEALKGRLYRSDDLFFVDPQKFLICLMINEQSEVWNLMLWSAVENRERIIGEVHISHYDPNDMKSFIDVLPYYQGYEALQQQNHRVLVSVMLTENVDEREQLPIVAHLVESLKSRLDIDYEQIEVTLSITDRIYNYQYVPEFEEE